MSDVYSTNRDINALTETAKAACELFLQKCGEEGLDVFLTETYRSQERQNYLYEQGRTRPGQVVTWTKNSRHTSRRAWDIAVNPPNDLYDMTVLRQAGEIGQELGITWGGSWDTPDYPHFEVSENYTLPEVEEEVEKVYKWTSEIPEWGRPTIQKLLDKMALAGRAPDNLDLTESTIRVLVVLDRIGLFD